MRNHAITALVRTALSIAIGATAHTIGSMPASAQGFQRLFGGTSCREAGRSVIQLAAGGYVTAGETFSTGAPCGTSDIYVVKTATNGALIWGFRYNIGTNDSATGVLESTFGGEIIVCGVCNGTGVAGTRDIFLMRLNPVTGAIIGVRAYGTTTTDEIAWDVIQATTGDGVTTNPGDYVVAGSTTRNAGAVGNRDAYLLRTQTNLNLIWDRQYGGTASKDDFFYSLDESTIPAPVGAGDIVAVGGSNTWGPVGTGYNILVMRVSGQNGTIGAAPQNAAVYSGAQDDIARSVQQIRIVTGLAGDFMIGGITKSRPAPSTNNEAFALEIQGDPCLVQRSDTYFGDNAGGDDGAYDLREIRAGAGLQIGQVIFTGYTVQGAGGTVLGTNAFLQEIRPSTNLSVFPAGAEIYGGNLTDVGWSVNVATRTSATENPGYIVSGYTQSTSLMAAGDPQQLYLIKTRANKQSGCNELATQFSTLPANFPRTCFIPATATIGSQFDVHFSSVALATNSVLCFAFPKARDEGDGGNDGAAGVGASSVIALAEGSATVYPNPIARGTALNVRFDLATAADATIIVTDLVGREVYRSSERIEPGNALATLSTEGWAAGPYIVEISSGTRHASVKIVVADR